VMTQPFNHTCWPANYCCQDEAEKSQSWTNDCDNKAYDDIIPERISHYAAMNKCVPLANVDQQYTTRTRTRLCICRDC
jgi:hypothetical protein